MKMKNFSFSTSHLVEDNSNPMNLFVVPLFSHEKDYSPQLA